MTRALSRSVCRRPRNQVPAFDEALVVEIDRVLRREHAPHTERTRLLQERQHRRLCGRVRDGREEAEHLVHVEQRAQAGRARLGPHPRDDLVQQERHEEHALGIRQVRDREDRYARLAFRRPEEALDVERLPCQPRGEPGRGEQVVERHRQRAPFLRGVERLDVHDADALERRLLDVADQAREVDVTPAAQAVSTSLASRMCSRLRSGSASIARSASNPETVPLIFSRRASSSSITAGGGDASDRRMETERPAELPGV